MSQVGKSKKKNYNKNLSLKLSQYKGYYRHQNVLYIYRP